MRILIPRRQSEDFADLIDTVQCNNLVNDIFANLRWIPSRGKITLPADFQSDFFTDSICFGDGVTYYELPSETCIIHIASKKLRKLILRETRSGNLRLHVYSNIGTSRISRVVLTLTPTLELIGASVFHEDMPRYAEEQNFRDLRIITLELLPILLGYLHTVNDRPRERVRLGPPKIQNVTLEPSGSNTQYLGPVREVVNPRDNPTGGVKAPHERSGHRRLLRDGTYTWVRATKVHADEFEPTSEPKKIKF